MTDHLPPDQLAELCAALLGDDDLSDEEVETLLAVGVPDANDVLGRLSREVDRLEAVRRRQQLDAARRERTGEGEQLDLLAEVRRRCLGVAELIKEILVLRPEAVAHRDLQALTRADLESQLADLLMLQGERAGTGEQ
jgi:hypothetical protein